MVSTRRIGTVNAAPIETRMTRREKGSGHAVPKMFRPVAPKATARKMGPEIFRVLEFRADHDQGTFLLGNFGKTGRGQAPPQARMPRWNRKPTRR